MTNPYETSHLPAERQPQEPPPPEPGSVAYGVVVPSLGLYASGVPEAQQGDTAAALVGGFFILMMGAVVLAGARLIVRSSYPRS